MPTVQLLIPDSIPEYREVDNPRTRAQVHESVCKELAQASETLPAFH